jgi:6-pyruvoyltetrahydropterin/6-carboxytetrahydropterin synthase
MIYLTRRERFNAAHKLYKEEWTEEENLAFFGGCANPNWHGHNYELFVTVKGNINPETGFVVDLKKLSHLLNEKIIAKVDHKNLNLDVPFLKGKIASTENLAVAIWEQLENDIAKLGAQLHCIEIKETENNTIKYYGQKP